MILKEPPPIDAHDRAITVDSLKADQSFEIVGNNEIVLRGENIEKRIRFSDAGGDNHFLAVERSASLHYRNFFYATTRAAGETGSCALE